MMMTCYMQSALAGLSDEDTTLMIQWDSKQQGAMHSCRSLVMAIHADNATSSWIHLAWYHVCLVLDRGVTSL